MGKKILKTLTNNLGFKLLALLFAVILWLVVYNVDDPVITRPYAVNVALLNEDSVKDKYYEILDNTNNVTFSVSAKRSILDKMDDSDFSASADFNELVVSNGGIMGSVKINISANRYSNSLKINGSGTMLLVSLEDAKSKQFVVTATTEGNVAEGYALGDVTISSSNVIKVSGPATVVSQIAKVVAAINVEGMSQNLSDSVVPVLYDENGNEVDTTTLTLSRTTVTVSAVILGTKKVSLSFSAKGTPAEGYALGGIESEVTSVWVKGATSVINPISTIEIPGRVLDITNLSASFDTTINITEYLPNGVSLLNASDATIPVSVDIEAYETRTFEIPVENITIEGLALENEITFPLGVVYVNITGLAGDLNTLTANQLRGNVDVTDMTTGSHVVNVELDIDTTKFSLASSRTQVNISVKEDETQDENNPETDSEITDDNAGNASENETDNATDDTTESTTNNTTDNTTDNTIGRISGDATDATGGEI